MTDSLVTVLCGALLFVPLSYAVYRASRLAIADKVFDRPRFAVYGWLSTREGRLRHFASWVRDMISCGWCLTVWMSFFVVALVDILGYPIPVPPVYALAVAGGAAGVWQKVEPD